MIKSESIENLAKAMAKFQQELEQPEKSADNPFFKSKYVPLPAVISVIKKYAHKHGLSYMQMPITNERGIGVETIVMHESGEYIQFDPFFLPMDKQTAQGAGSSTTYAKRYALSAAFGIDSDIDDDGNSASQPQKQQSNTKPYQQSQNVNTSPNKASDKQIGFVNKLITDLENSKKGTEDESKWTRNNIKIALCKKEDVGFFESTKDLTSAQASAAIKHLQAMLGGN